MRDSSLTCANVARVVALIPAFALVGLGKTNSNALARGILIHPAVGPLSWGCVTLPVVRYHQLSEFLKTQTNMIMWVYE